MGGTLAITDFQHLLVGYLAQDRTDYQLKMRHVYTNPGTAPSPTDLVASAGAFLTAPLLQPSGRAAHVYIYATDASAALKVHRRRVPVSAAFNVAAPPMTNATVIDGLTLWAYGGFRGQKDRGGL